ncbi:MAG: hypothetical protein A3B70_02780 [Deltaproteobacteria bacterium RIFCSPHIGHO2_02_FULL_40_11]|nr:MAG: hypothetical protein A3B70_02780 [Deltaproteobacteria bacterium RIFCSPHIGHO2_02_FULL_40_11]
MKHNQFGKISILTMVALIITISLPVLLYKQYNTYSALVPAGKVIEVSGLVEELKLTREAKTIKLKLDDALYYDDWIVTGPNSATRVVIEDKSIDFKVSFFVFENSTLKVSKMLVDKNKGRKIVAEHGKGMIRAFAKGLKGGDEVQIKYPNTTIGIRGTVYQGMYYEDVRQKTVEGGEVHFWVSPAEGAKAILHLADGRQIDITAAVECRVNTLTQEFQLKQIPTADFVADNVEKKVPQKEKPTTSNQSAVDKASTAPLKAPNAAESAAIVELAIAQASAEAAQSADDSTENSENTVEGGGGGADPTE